MRYRWNIHLDAKLELGAAHGRTVDEAYLELAAEQPVLRAVLDARTASRGAGHVSHSRPIAVETGWR